MKNFCVGDVMIVVRVPHGSAVPKGFQHKDAALKSHHGKYGTHAIKIIKRKKKRRKK